MAKGRGSAKKIAIEAEQLPEVEASKNDTMEAVQLPPIIAEKEEKSLMPNQFKYDNNIFEIKAPKFIIDNTEYSREKVLKSPKLQKQLAELIYYKNGNLRPLHKVKSSVLKVIF